MKLLRTLITHSPFLLTFLIGCGLFVPDIATAEADPFGESVIYLFLYGLVLTLFGSLLGIAGTLLDTSINNFVIGFGDGFLTQGVGEAVDILWVTVRDFFNVMFIFGLVFIGFKMILNSDDSNTKRNLIYLIMAALLINFSLFITKFVVDFTNILATEIALEGFPEINSETGERVEGSVDIADRFFSYMKIPETLNADPSVVSRAEAPWLFIFGNAMIYIVGAFAFGVGAFMLIVRFAILSIYMVLSPFMFIGWVFPGFASTGSKYWSGFLKQAFYAPVYMILIYFAGAILSRMFGPSGSAQNFSIGTNAGSADSFASILGPFILSATFMIAAVQIAGKLSADGSVYAAKIGAWGQGKVRGAVRGSIRNTAGYGMTYGVNKYGEKAQQGIRRRTARLAQSDKWPVRSLARGIDGTAGAAAGKVANSRLAGSETLAESRTRIAAKQNEFNSTFQQNDRSAAIAAYLKNPLSEENKTKARGAVAKLSDDELKALTKEQRQDENLIGLFSPAQMKTLAGSGNMVTGEIKSMGATSENLAFKDFEDKLNKTSITATELNEAMEGLGKVVSRLSGDSLTGLSFNRLNTEAVSSQLSEKQMESLKESGKLTTAQYDDLSKTRNDAIIKIISNGRVDAQTKDDKGKVTSTESASISGSSDKEVSEATKKQRERFIKSNAEAIGKLSFDAFVGADKKLTRVGEQITVDMMKAIGRAANQGKSDMTDEEREALALIVSKNKELYTSRMATYLSSNKGKDDFLVDIPKPKKKDS